jgi:membrane-bound lytic murein transglycosylase D
MSLRRSRLAIALALAWATAGPVLGADGSGEPTPAPTPSAPSAAPSPAAGAPAPVAGGAADASLPSVPSVPSVASAPALPPAAGATAPGPLPDASVPAASDPAPAPAAGSAAALPGAPTAPALRRGDEVFARIRAGLSRDPCAAGEASTRWQKRYAVNPRALAIQFERILPLLDFVSVEVARSGLPAEFVFIPLVESWYKPEAIGVGGPAGMWQMIGTTAKNHGIHIRPGYDGRLSPVESTRAALSYLKVLYQMFDGWEATVMAYNAGEGRLLKAFKRARSREASGNRRRPHGLSNITYDYVAKLQALSCLVTQPERHRLALPLATRFVPLAPVLMGPGVDNLDQFARRAGRDPAALRKLNPAFRNGVVVAGIPRMVLTPQVSAPVAPAEVIPAPVLASLPPAAAAAAMPLATTPPDPPKEASLAMVPDVLSSNPSPAVVAATLADAASGAATATPAVGGAATATATVPQAATPPPAAVTLAIASGAEPSPTDAPPATHRVQAGESLWTIAKVYDMRVEELRVLNALGKSPVLRPGQTLKLKP